MAFAQHGPPELGDVCNMVPQTRKERLSQQHREDLEKMRIMARREKFCRYEDGGIAQPQDSLGYITEADRFVTDIAAVVKNERDAEIAKREQIHYNKRLSKVDREEKRWRTIEMEHQVDQQRWDDMRENGTFSRSNKTSMPYNPINLRYDDGNDGDRLRFSDESLKYRGALRAEHLQRRGASTPHNPITGAPIAPVHVPTKPAKPM